MDPANRQQLRQPVSAPTKKGQSQVHEILTAARDVFIDEGYAKLSLRRVATRAGVTYGSVQHYFFSKADLVEAMLLNFQNEIQIGIERAVNRLPEGSPVKQFEVVMRYVLEFVESDTGQKLLFEIGALASRFDFAAVTLNKSVLNGQKTARALIRAIQPDLDRKELDIRASIVLELLMGVMFLSGKNRRANRDRRKLMDRTIQAMTDISVQPLQGYK